jgi:hypothetical protein
MDSQNNMDTTNKDIIRNFLNVIHPVIGNYHYYRLLFVIESEDCILAYGYRLNSYIHSFILESNKSLESRQRTHLLIDYHIYIYDFNFQTNVFTLKIDDHKKYDESFRRIAEAIRLHSEGS